MRERRLAAFAPGKACSNQPAGPRRRQPLPSGTQRTAVKDAPGYGGGAAAIQGQHALVPHDVEPRRQEVPVVVPRRLLPHLDDVCTEGGVGKRRVRRAYIVTGRPPEAQR